MKNLFFLTIGLFLLSCCDERTDKSPFINNDLQGKWILSEHLIDGENILVKFMWEYSELNFIKTGDVTGEMIWTTITDPQNTAVYEGDYEVIAFGDSIIFSNCYWADRYSLKIINDNIELNAILGSHIWVLRGDKEE